MTEKMEFYPGFDIRPTTGPFGFAYGEGVFGPAPEIRRLDDIRASLADPDRFLFVSHPEGYPGLWKDYM